MKVNGQTVIHEPTIITDGGPWAEHDMACGVCRKKPAVMNLNGWTFSPCWSCQRAGWNLYKWKGPKWMQKIAKALLVESR